MGEYNESFKGEYSKSFINWRRVQDSLPRNGQRVLMAWKPERSVMQGKYSTGKDSSLHGFCTKIPGCSYYVGKVGVTHWCPLSEVLP